MVSAVFRAASFTMLVFFYSCGTHPIASRSESQLTSLKLILGSQRDPQIESRPGAGEWNSETKSFENRIVAKSALKFFATEQARQQWGDEAATALHHYFENNGRDLRLDVSKLIQDVSSVKEKFELSRQLAKDLSLGLSDGIYLFTSEQAGTGLITKEDSENWYLAVAGYCFWIKGKIVIADGKTNITSEFTIWDRYDWDPGVQVQIDTPIGPIVVDQDRIGEFHRQGLAKEFNFFGSIALF